MNASRIKIMLYVLLGVAFVFKLAYVLMMFTPDGIVVDAKDYFDFAQLILRDGPFVPNQDEIEAFAPPGFPWLVALTQWLTGWIGAIVILNAIFSTATLLVIYKIANHFLPKIWSLAMAVWALIYVPYTMYLGNILKEGLIIFLVSLAALMVLEYRKTSKSLYVIALSGIFTYTFHSDERFFMLLPLMLLAVAWPIRSSKRFKHAFLFLLGIGVFSAPWFIRNYQVYERPVFVTERLQSPLDKRLGIENRKVIRDKRIIETKTKYRDSLLAGEKVTEARGKLLSITEALDVGLMPHTFSKKERIWYNSLGYWSPIRTRGILIENGWKYKGPRSMKVNVLYTLNYGILLPFMLIGIFFAFKRKEKALLWLISILGLHYALHVLLIFGSGRYRHPVDFIIILLAFYGVWCLVKSSSLLKRAKSQSRID